jgi:hypothetical protein
MLMREPLLRSTDVLSALFHIGAVVCEADADRCFYQEINTRLLTANDGGVRDSVFLNAQNKSTIRKIVGPLRRMGIAAAAVVDFDIFRKTDLRDLLIECGVPEPLRHSLTVLRGDVEAHFEMIGQKMKSGGMKLLSGGEAASCRSLIDQLAVYGIFVVPDGEIESWLTAFGITAKKNEWLAEVFEKLGSDPASGSYVVPGIGDVWEFVRGIGAWVGRGARLGMPVE